VRQQDVVTAYQNNRAHYRFFLRGGHQIVGRPGPHAPDPNLVELIQTHPHPGGNPDHLRVLIRTDAIVAIQEL